ncbi:unnamed protein product [Ixodes pacificus]
MEALGRRFCGSRRKPKEVLIELAYNLRSNLVEWLKCAEVCGNHNGMMIAAGMLEAIRYRVQDKNPDTTYSASFLNTTK